MDRLRVAPGLALGLAAAIMGAAPLPGDVAAGREIYDYGEGLKARIPGMVTACAACHGSDGRGGSEGGVAAPSLVALAGSDRAVVEPILAAALRDGRGAGGRPLLAIMPRIDVNAMQVRALSAYLMSLPSPPHPGIDPRTIRIAIDLDRAPLSPQRAAVLHATARATVARWNATGGIFGRALDIVPPDQPAFLRVAWAADAAVGTETVTYRADRSDDAECARCCASLHPPVEEQVAAVRTWLERKDTTDGRRRIVVSRPAELRGVARDDDVYLVADAPGLGPPPRATARLHLVLAGDIDRRRASRPPDGQAPLDAAERNLVIETELLFAALSTALMRAGRHPSPRNVCQAVRQSLANDRRLSVIAVENGAIETLDLDGILPNK